MLRDMMLELLQHKLVLSQYSNLNWREKYLAFRTKMIFQIKVNERHQETINIPLTNFYRDREGFVLLIKK